MNTTPDKPRRQVALVLPTPIYRRCPGCFSWHFETNMMVYPCGTFDDFQSVILCAQCDSRIKRNHNGPEEIGEIIRNIGSYVGWKDQEVG